MTLTITPITVTVALCCTGIAQAASIKGETITGSFDSTISTGAGFRVHAPSCGSVVGSFGGSATPTQPIGPEAPAGCVDLLSGYNDQGNLNYAQHDRFTTYVKGTHDLTLKFPQEITFFGRVSWLRDFSATHTTGILSGLGSTQPIPNESEKDMREKIRLLDLWVSKDFTYGEQKASVRVGNQVLKWGESLFLGGGINQTNSIDIYRSLQPGAQAKEFVLPAPIVDVTTTLGKEWSIEAYLQRGWSSHNFPPVGSYWSYTSIGKGAKDYGYPTTKSAKDGGQGGAALRYQPEGTEVKLGLYAMRYHDKFPVYVTSQSSASGFALEYLENRKLFGVSAGFPLGNWTIGTELSYRPKDAVTLNLSAPGLTPTALTPALGTAFCLGNGKCYAEEKKYQFHLTGTLNLTKEQYGPLLRVLGADSAAFAGEFVATRYPGLQPAYQGVPIAAGAWGNGYDTTLRADATGAGVPASFGTRTSYGYNFDFSWVYEGLPASGWKLMPQVYVFHALKGRTPSLSANFMKGAKNVNMTLHFIDNPGTWQVSVTYSRFFGGTTVFDQPLRDRSFVGATVSHSF